MEVDNINSSDNKLLLVNSSVLPDSLIKVLEAKRLIAQGKAKNSTQAAQMVGVSRSAFYRYKDFVFDYNPLQNTDTVTLHLRLSDEAGVLSGVITKLYRYGTNILTINQNIPVDGVAPVSISISTLNINCPLESLLKKIKTVVGVVEVKKM